MYGGLFVWMHACSFYSFLRADCGVRSLVFRHLSNKVSDLSNTAVMVTRSVEESEISGCVNTIYTSKRLSVYISVIPVSANRTKLFFIAVNKIQL